MGQLKFLLNNLTQLGNPADQGYLHEMDGDRKGRVCHRCADAHRLRFDATTSFKTREYGAG